jgi:hypothetical protein
VTISLGLGTVCGLARESLVTVPTWPATSAAIVTSSLPLLSATLSDGANLDFGASPSTPFGSQPGVVVGISPSAHVELDMRYGGMETLLCLALGAMPKRIGSVVLPQPVGGAYRYAIEIAPTFGTSDRWSAADGVEPGDGLDVNLRKVRRGTLVLSRGVSTWEFLSAVVSQISFALTDEGKATCSVDFNAYSLSRTSSINTLATMRTIPPNTAPNVLDIDLRLRLAPASATVPLDVGDELCVSAFSVTLQNYLLVEPGPRTGLYAEEITKNTTSGISGTFTLPRYSADTLINAWPAGTVFMLGCTFTGPLIPGTAVPYRLTFALPAIQFTTAIVPLPMGAAPVNIGWYAIQPPAIGYGLPIGRNASPLVLELYTDQAAHPLLAA